MSLFYPVFPLESRTQDRLLCLEVVLGNKKWDLKSTTLQGHNIEQATIVVNMLDLLALSEELCRHVSELSQRTEGKSL